MATRLPPKAMAKKLVRVLRSQHPDYHYLKKVFQHTRELLAVEPSRRPKRLPELWTDADDVLSQLPSCGAIQSLPRSYWPNFPIRRSRS